MQPLWRFETTERAVLQPLPATPYDLATWKEVTVQRDCYVTFEGSFYSAPFRAIGQRVRVRGGGQEVKLYGPDYALLATHPRAAHPGERHTHRDHLPPEKLPGLTLNRAACRATAASIGPATAAVVHDLLADPAVDRGTTVGRVLRLRDRYGDDRLEAACVRAHRRRVRQPCRDVWPVVAAYAATTAARSMATNSATRSRSHCLPAPCSRMARACAAGMPRR